TCRSSRATAPSWCGGGPVFVRAAAPPSGGRRRNTMKTEMYCYLEDHEKKVLPETDVWNQWLDPDCTAIACIDMHRGHVGDDPELTLPAPRARDRIPAHNLFHRYAREV